MTDKKIPKAPIFADTYTPAERRVLDTVTHAHEMGNFAHATILEGGSVSSRLRCAEYIACSLVCEHLHDAKPCLSCRQCRKVLENEHTDIKRIEAEEVGKEVKVDAVRALRKDAYVLPTECEYHVYLFPEAQSMNTAAQNALLKLLEEPPQNTVFLLLTPSKELLLPTVVSRAQAHRLGISTEHDEIETMRMRFPNCDDTTVRRAARLQRLSDNWEWNAAAVEAIPKAYELVKLCFADRSARLDEKLGSCTDAELSAILCVLALAARDIAVESYAKDGKTVVFEPSDEELFQKARKMRVKRASELYDAFSTAAERIREHGNKTVVLNDLYGVLRAKQAER